MNTCPTPELPVEPDTDLEMNEAWDSSALSDLIRTKSTPGVSPAYLFVGRHEALLLRAHLGAAFGDEAVASLKSLYYMGLEVIEIEMERCLKVAGCKVLRTLQDPISRRPAWRDRELDSLWSLRIA